MKTPLKSRKWAQQSKLKPVSTVCSKHFSEAMFAANHRKAARKTSCHYGPNDSNKNGQISLPGHKFGANAATR
jgi:hypothetical protein